MAFTTNFAYPVLFVAFLVTTLSLPAQELHIVDDLPDLSASVVVNLCSTSTFPKANPVKWTTETTPQKGAAWVRALITVDAPPSPRDFTIEIVDKDNQPVESLDGSRFTSTSHVWSKVMPGDSISLVVRSSSILDGYRFCLQSVNVPKASPTIKSLINGRDDREDLFKDYGRDHRYFSYGQAVADIRFQKLTSGAETNCTGVLISASLLATNNHCISVKEQLLSASAIFGFDSGNPAPVEVGIEELVATSEDLDYSVLRLTKSMPFVGRLSTDHLQSQRRLILIQHPGNARKLVAVKKCRVKTLVVPNRPTDFVHLCDSSGGSSGSPLMDESSGIIYGLHHLGIEPPHKEDYVNFAVYFREIMADIQHRAPQVAEEIRRVQATFNSPKSEGNL